MCVCVCVCMCVCVCVRVCVCEPGFLKYSHGDMSDMTNEYAHTVVITVRPNVNKTIMKSFGLPSTDC